jgi:squalene-associated FAD-dependent desaturase
MRSALIIGGGLAGLSAGVYAIRNGYKPIILEAAPRLGGRAQSFFDTHLNTVIDNGQHILMGCYKNTLQLMNICGASDNFIYQDSLRAAFIDNNAKEHRLRCPKFIYPYNLLWGILHYSALTIPERMLVIKFFIRLLFQPTKWLGNRNVREWLSDRGQSERISGALWDFISIGALNTNPEKASARLFAHILREMFLKGNFNSTIILPKYDLTRSLIEPMEKHITDNGGTIVTSKRAVEISLSGNAVSSITTDDGKEFQADQYVLAIPPYAIAKLIDAKAVIDAPLDAFSYSTIVSIHIRTNEINLSEPFYGPIGSKIHWLFRHDDHISLVISSADKYMDMSDETIMEMVSAELKTYFSIRLPTDVNYRIIKSKRATFVPSPDIVNRRPSARIKYTNLFLAGDWIDTGLPATIEGAVLSGKEAICNLMH